CRLQNLVAHVDERYCSIEQDNRIVIHRQYSERLALRKLLRRDDCRVFGHTWLGGPKANLDLCPSAQLTFEQKAAATLLHHALNHGQSEPSTFTDALGGEERLDCTLECVLVHAFSLI